MHESGLLIVTKYLTSRHLAALFRLANSCIRNRLYLTVESHPISIPLISFCYSHSGALSEHIDLRLLSSNWCLHNERRCGVVLCDDSSLTQSNVLSIAQKYLRSPPSEIVYNIFSTVDKESVEFNEERNLVNLHANVALGGTFDRLHCGHKILLTTGAMVASKMLTVGVTSPEMLSRKVLGELIEPVECRMHCVNDFVSDIKPEILCHVVKLADPYGPPIVVPDYEALVASQETVPGCQKINDIRQSASMSVLPIYTVDFARENQTSNSDLLGPCEDKVSSSNNRVKLLGTLLKPPFRRHVSNTPYVIGLTGGICSGKSSLLKRLEGLGAGIVDCDLLGHQSYSPGTKEFDLLIKTFGEKFLNAEGCIDRRSLGTLVFSDKKELKKLTDIVWPRIKELTQQNIAELYVKGHKIIVIEAAVLLEAEWHIVCHEVWISIINRTEAISRLQARNGWTIEKAEASIDAQMSNHDRLRYANVVLSTLWDPSFTQKQVEKAWSALEKRLDLHFSSNL